jgi:hypothetical protein
MPGNASLEIRNGAGIAGAGKNPVTFSNYHRELFRSA